MKFTKNSFFYETMLICFLKMFILILLRTVVLAGMYMKFGTSEDGHSITLRGFFDGLTNSFKTYQIGIHIGFETGFLNTEHQYENERFYCRRIIVA